LVLENREGIQAILCTGQSDIHGAGLAVSSPPVFRRHYVAGFDIRDEIIKKGVSEKFLQTAPPGFPVPASGS
jgi:hypothetical protein